jgi:hypothetical protein
VLLTLEYVYLALNRRATEFVFRVLKKIKAIPVRREYGCQVSRIPNFLYNELTDSSNIIDIGIRTRDLDLSACRTAPQPTTLDRCACNLIPPKAPISINGTPRSSGQFSFLFLLPNNLHSHKTLHWAFHLTTTYCQPLILPHYLESWMYVMKTGDTTHGEHYAIVYQLCTITATRAWCETGSNKQAMWYRECWLATAI